MIIRDGCDVRVAIETLQQQDLILEAFVPFSQEVSLVCACSIHGDVKFYPLAINQHHEGILRVTHAPANDTSLQKTAEVYASRIIQELGYAGIITIEFFVHGKQLVANEIAPRVHNTGHWTIEGAVTSQFENHLRAITGMPLGATDAVGHSVMLNLVGGAIAAESILNIPNAHFHTYGKTPRPGRKVGHVTVNHSDKKHARMLANQVFELILPHQTGLSTGEHKITI